MSDMLTKEAVLHVLSGVEDPELKKPLTELDMIKSVDINNGDVCVGVLLTIPGCPLKEKITQDITEAVQFIPGVNSVKVEFGVMSDQQRDQLMKKLGIGSNAKKQEASIVNFSKRFIAVTSGKGGVGKSTVTSNLATALMRLGNKVGVLDADVYGFSIPRMLGITGQPTILDDKILPIRYEDSLQVVSMGFFVGEDDAVIWRGPLLHKAINQFLSDVIWDDLDYLLLDLPPGTGDVTLTIAQKIPKAELLIVTTPQATATHVAGRVAKLAEKTKLKILGVIENMSYFEQNGHREYIFGRDGGKKLAKRLNVEFLGEIPLITSIREGADQGRPVANVGTESEIKMFETIARTIVASER